MPLGHVPLGHVPLHHVPLHHVRGSRGSVRSDGDGGLGSDGDGCAGRQEPKSASERDIVAFLAEQAELGLKECLATA